MTSSRSKSQQKRRDLFSLYASLGAAVLAIVACVAIGSWLVLGWRAGRFGLNFNAAAVKAMLRDHPHAGQAQVVNHVSLDDGGTLVHVRATNRGMGQQERFYKVTQRGIVHKQDDLGVDDKGQLFLYLFNHHRADSNRRALSLW